MAKKKIKISPNTVLTSVVLVGTGIVLYKLFKVASEYEKLAKNIQTKGIINSL